MTMRLYESTIERFREDVIENKIADVISKRFEEYYGTKPNTSEVNSWNISLRFMKDALEYSDLRDNHLTIEYELAYSSRRIDVLLFGKSISDQDNIVLIELKQWSNQNVFDCKTDGNVIVDFGRFRKEVVHPSLQVEGYHLYLKDFMTIFEEEPNISLSSCVYCHNYSRKEGAALYSQKFQKYIEKYPVFSKGDIKILGDYLKEKLSNGSGFEVFNRFINSPLKPSKKLLEHTNEMINKQQIFNLIDDQITAYNAIMHRAKRLADAKKKSVIIVKGGPGTGKSVIALEVMAGLLRKGKMVFHATGSSAFTNTLRKILGNRLRNLFKFFFNFTKHGDNKIDILICDEAHRIRKDSSDWGVPYNLKSKNPQVDDLVRPAKLSIFFLDEYQVVRPYELGTVELIKNSASKFNADVYEFELKTQFRCSGSDSFLLWIENILDVKKSEKQFLTKEDRMEFKIVSSPHELKKIIDEKNREKKNCARLVAGFCWPWSKPRPDGTLVDDVVIGDFKMPWERKNQFWKWATEDEGMEQVGTVYTAQGFEFDYIGVIFGNDLAYDPNKKEWISKPENSHDLMVKRNNKKLTKHIKNVYRVLLSRAHKGVYVYFMDKNTEIFFKSKIENPT